MSALITNRHYDLRELREAFEARFYAALRPAGVAPTVARDGAMVPAWHRPIGAAAYLQWHPPSPCGDEDL